jgi:hypothetical protein
MAEKVKVSTIEQPCIDVVVTVGTTCIKHKYSAECDAKSIIDNLGDGNGSLMSRDTGIEYLSGPNKLLPGRYAYVQSQEERQAAGQWCIIS